MTGDHCVEAAGSVVLKANRGVSRWAVKKDIARFNATSGSEPRPVVKSKLGL